FPLQFTGDVEVTAHMVDRSKSYPPWLKKVKVDYDYNAGQAKAIVVEGLDSGKTFIRRYDTKREYMIQGGDFPVCRRSYLGEEMPLPEFPSQAVFQGTEDIDGSLCHHWLIEHGPSRVHVYSEVDTKLPRRVTDEVTIAVEPLMTYDFYNLSVGAAKPEAFELPHPYTHEDCGFVVSGFPYLHLFHHYFRF
ncbi:unnamed protein product, partial [Chrysoparadoxa australica]